MRKEAERVEAAAEPNYQFKLGGWRRAIRALAQRRKAHAEEKERKGKPHRHPVGPLRARSWAVALEPPEGGGGTACIYLSCVCVSMMCTRTCAIRC